MATIQIEKIASVQKRFNAESVFIKNAKYRQSLLLDELKDNIDTLLCEHNVAAEVVIKNELIYIDFFQK